MNMITKIYKELIILILVFLGCWFGIAMLRPDPSVPDLKMDIATEEKIGDKMAESYLDDFQNSDNDSLRVLLDSVAQRLIDAQPNPAFTYHLHLIESAEVNAYASMGGHIFVHTALIGLCEAPEELAAVLAHEMGHVQFRHVSDRLVSELGLTVLLTLATGGDPSVASEVARYGLSSAFSRDDEREADKFGLDLLYDSKIHPVHMATLFRRFKSIGGSLPDGLAFMSSHPGLEERIRMALEYKVSDDFEAIPYSLEWPNGKEE